MKWKQIRIGDIGEVITGNTPPKANPEYYGGEYKFIKPTDMEVGMRFTPYTEECYSQLAYEKYKNSLIPPFSTCVVTIGSIGKKITLADDFCFVNQAVNAVVPDEKKYDPYFVFYALKNILLKVKAADTGASSGRENVSKSNFSNLTLNVPSQLEDQRLIGSILSAYDDLIENNTKRIKLLEEVAQNIYKEWFVHFRFLGYEKAKFENGLPKGWRRDEMGKISTYLGRGVTPKYMDGSGFWAINQKANKGVTLDKSQFKEYDTELNVPDEKFAYFGDLLINSLGEGTIGRVCFYTGDDKIYPVDQHMSIYRPSKHYYSLYLYCFFSSDYGQSKLMTIKKGATNMTMLNINDLRGFEVVLASDTIIEQFYDLVIPLFQQKQTLIDQNEKLKEARDILLPRLMNGEIEVDATIHELEEA